MIDLFINKEQIVNQIGYDDKNMLCLMWKVLKMNVWVYMGDSVASRHHKCLIVNTTMHSFWKIRKVVKNNL